MCDNNDDDSIYAIAKPENRLEFAANELEFDDVCFCWEAESLEVSLLHHHGNLDKLPEYLHTTLVNMLNNDGIPYIDNVSQMVENSKEKTATMLVHKWLTERDDPDGNGIWFRKQK